MTYQHRTKRGAVHWAIAMAIALVGAVTLFAGAALPAAAVDPPVVTGVSPLSGSTGGGTVLTFTGTGITAAPTAVSIGGNAATAVTYSAGQFTATTPPGTGSNLAIGVTFSDESPATTLTQKFTYVAPAITSLSPSVGPIGGGTAVQINGTNFGPNPTVTWAGANLVTNSASDTSISVTTPPHAAGTVQLTVKAGSSSSTPATFIYQNAPAPTITNINPNPAAAGAGVTITGTHLSPPGGSNCPINIQVHWGATTLTDGNCQVVSDSQINAYVPAGTGTASVTVTTVNGTSDAFTFTYGTGTTPPSITSVTPSSGPVGTVLTITGSNLAPSSSVTVGGVNCPIVSGSTDTQLTCTTQGNVPSLTHFDVVVNALGGSATATNAFYYTNSSAVTVTNVIPNVCPLAGGNTLYVYGTGFINGSTTVKVNGLIAPNLNVISSTQLSVTCPGQNSYGTYDLSVTSGGNTSANTQNDNVTYQASGAAPVISNVQPASGPTTGGTAVTITGANFVSPATVTFDGIAATSVVVVSTTTITAVTPAHAATGLVTVAVSTGNGTDTDVYAFTYTNTAAPTVTAVSPNSGPVGTTVTVTGTNFLGATGVTIGGVAATFTVTSNTTLTATVASGTPLGVVNVLVTTPSGTSANTVNDNFTNTNSKTLTTTLTGFFTLIGWVGVDNISVADALRGGPNGPSGGTNNITAQVSVVWGFNSATQTFLAYFPAQANVPGANDLTTLRSGVGYFIGLLNPNSTVQWTYALGA